MYHLALKSRKDARTASNAGAAGTARVARTMTPETVAQIGALGAPAELLSVHNQVATCGDGDTADAGPHSPHERDG